MSKYRYQLSIKARSNCQFRGVGTERNLDSTVGDVVVLSELLLGLVDLVVLRLLLTLLVQGQGWLDSSGVQSPGAQSVLSVDDDLLGSLVTVVSWSGLTWGDSGLVQQLQQSLTVSGYEGILLSQLSGGVESVVESSLQLLSGDVRQLSLSNQGLGLSSDQLLLQDRDLWRLWVLVLQVSNLVSDLLLSVSGRSDGRLDVSDGLQGDSVSVVLVDVLVLQFTDLVDQNTQLVGNVGNVLVVLLTPQGQLLGGLTTLSGGQLNGSHDVLLHLDVLSQFLGQLGSTGTSKTLLEGGGDTTLTEKLGLGRRSWWCRGLHSRGGGGLLRSQRVSSVHFQS